MTIRCEFLQILLAMLVAFDLLTGSRRSGREEIVRVTVGPGLEKLCLIGRRQEGISGNVSVLVWFCKSEMHSLLS